MLATTRMAFAVEGQGHGAGKGIVYSSASPRASRIPPSEGTRSYDNSRSAFLLSYLPGAVSHLPILSPFALRLADSITHNRCSTDELISAAVTDPFLSARLIGLANSIAYNTKHDVVRTVTKAISRVGPEVANRLLTETPRLEVSATEASRLLEFWTRCIAVAHTAREIAGYSSHAGIDVDAIYWMGLVHDIGYLLEIHYYRRHLAEVIDRILSPGESFHSHAHAKIGSHLAHCWSLPACAVQAIRWHHAPTQCLEGEGQKAAAIIYLADRLVTSVMYRVPLHRNDCAEALLLAGIPVCCLRAISDSISQSDFGLSRVSRELANEARATQ